MKHPPQAPYSIMKCKNFPFKISSKANVLLLAHFYLHSIEILGNTVWLVKLIESIIIGKEDEKPPVGELHHLYKEL